MSTPPAKPLTRATAEDHATNLSRYVIGGFGPNAQAALGVKVNYPTTLAQGITVLLFETDSAAKSAGIILNDEILEVDGSAVGLIRNRHYEPWLHYGRSGEKTTEILVSFENSNGDRLYYYLPVKLSNVAGDAQYKSLPSDFFTTEKPTTRDKAETEEKNIARYAYGEGNFDKFSAWELGTELLSYSYDSGATVESIKAGFPAQLSGLKVGDCILEVDGAPLGVFGNRTYEIWKQYVYSKDGKVELLVNFTDPATGEFRYYYPQIQLKDKTSQA